MRLLLCLPVLALAACSGRPACYPTNPKLEATYILDMRSLCKGTPSVKDCVATRPEAAARKLTFQQDLAESIECTSL